MKVLFVVEGGSDAGLGHIYHSTTIADGLDSPVEAVFATESGEATRQKIRDHGYEVITADGTTVRECFSTFSPDTIVFDQPWLDVDTVEAARDALGPDARLVAIGNRNINLPDATAAYCDVIIDFDIGGSSRQSGRFFDEDTGTLNLVGLQYLVLRPEFYQHEELPRSPAMSADDISDVLLMFGASDPSNYSSTALAELLDAQPTYEIDVVLGPGFAHDAAFDAVLHERPDARDSVSVYRDVDAVAPRMRAADVVVTSPGLTMIEALLLCRPVVAFYQNNLQEIWNGYAFVHNPEKISQLEQLLREAQRSFDDMTHGLQLNFLKGRREVLDAIIGEYDEQ